jgi:hypothetical protein
VLTIRLAVHRQHAGAEAALDLVLDAGPAAVLEHRIAAGPEREDLRMASSVSRTADALANGPK